MHIVTTSIEKEDIRDKGLWFLKHLENEGVEIMSQEDMDDLKLLKATRDEESIPFSDYLND